MIGQATVDSHDAANWRWIALAISAIGAHQVESMVLERRQWPFRTAALIGFGLMPLILSLPVRVRGAILVAAGTPPTLGALLGHLVPVVRTGRVPAATETAILNLAGGSLLLSVGLALLARGSRRAS